MVHSLWKQDCTRERKRNQFKILHPMGLCIGYHCFIGRTGVTLFDLRPVVVWTKLQSQFQRKTWVNKLALRRQLHSLNLKDGNSVQDHIKPMNELFNEFAVVGDVTEEEDRVYSLTHLSRLLKRPKRIPRRNLLPKDYSLRRRSGKWSLLSLNLVKIEYWQQSDTLIISTREVHNVTTARNLDTPRRTVLKGSSMKKRTNRVELKHREAGNQSQTKLYWLHIIFWSQRASSELGCRLRSYMCHISSTKKLFEEFRPLLKPQKKSP